MDPPGPPVDDPPFAKRQRRQSAPKAFKEPGLDDLFDESEEPEVVKKAVPAAAAAPLVGPVTATARILTGETQHARCMLALDFLAELDIDGWFAEPVTDEIAPGYSEYVSEPMDVSTIRSKLEAGSYGDEVDAFADDVRLVYCNAVTYNWQPDNVVGASAVRTCMQNIVHLLSRMSVLGRCSALPPAAPAAARQQQRASSSSSCAASTSSSVVPIAAGACCKRLLLAPLPAARLSPLLTPLPTARAATRVTDCVPQRLRARPTADHRRQQRTRGEHARPQGRSPPAAGETAAALRRRGAPPTGGLCGGLWWARGAAPGVAHAH